MVSFCLIKINALLNVLHLKECIFLEKEIMLGLKLPRKEQIFGERCFDNLCTFVCVCDMLNEEKKEEYVNELTLLRR